ncbi:MAG: bifunctional DNA-formamidopyrimidine glycosylase/DNA-(apurinic or apyrimidinic site) lyase [Myxococcota bacterium]
MPELPEVELHRRHLEAWLAGHTVVDVKLKPAGLLGGVTAPQLIKRLTGAEMGVPLRRGKHLALPVASGGALYMHLGMTGHLTRRWADAPEPRFLTLSLLLDDGHAVELTDARRFSKLGWLKTTNIDEEEPFASLGPDLLTARPDAKALHALLQKRRTPIKLALMDQALLAGLGNIHAAEVLWRARIHPATPANTLDVKQAAALLKGIDATFKLVLDHDEGEGVTYVEEPGAPNPFKVYARDDEPCPRCKKKIAGFTQGGRTTYFCAACQPAPRAPRQK